MLKRREQPSIHREIPFHAGDFVDLGELRRARLSGTAGVMTRKKPGVTPAKCLVSYLALPVNFKAKGGAVEDGVTLVLQIGHGVTKSWAVEAFGIVDIKQ